MKITSPTAAEAAARTSTAAAEISFASFISEFLSRVTASASDSIAELNASAEITAPMQRITATHSHARIPKNTERAIASMAATAWILALCADLKSAARPLKAYRNDRALSANENLRDELSIISSRKAERTGRHRASRLCLR